MMFILKNSCSSFLKKIAIQTYFRMNFRMKFRMKLGLKLRMNFSDEVSVEVSDKTSMTNVFRSDVP